MIPLAAANLPKINAHSGACRCVQLCRCFYFLLLRLRMILRGLYNKLLSSVSVQVASSVHRVSLRKLKTVISIHPHSSTHTLQLEE